MSNGHYTAYVRSQADWYHCDDAQVTLATAEEVRSCRGYMLFYVAKQFQCPEQPSAKHTAGTKRKLES